MEIKEIWKTIEGYENYQCSNLGRVKSLNYNKTGKEKILKQEICRGYCYVTLYKDKQRKHFRVHRLVAQTFIPNLQNLPCVNHKDENKQNNCASNLEWCSYQYNNNYGLHNERMAKTLSIVLKGKIFSQEHKDKIGKALSKPIVQLTKNGEFIKYWKSTKQVERDLKINCSHITQCCKGKLKSAGKYKWKYLSDYINEQIPYLNELKAYRNRLYDILKKVS